MHHKYNYLILYNSKYKSNTLQLVIYKTPILYSDTIGHYPGLSLF